jgi:anti-anti-sigma factor
MSVSQEMSSDGKKIHINISGRFDYKVSQEFRDTYRQVPGQEGVAYYVNLSAASYMDSSALGMLLLLREHAKCRGGTVYIECPSEQVDSILKVANFEQLFTINYSSPTSIDTNTGMNVGVGAGA